MYQPRGLRVNPCDKADIELKAHRLCKILGFKPITDGSSGYDKNLEYLSKYNVTLIPVADDEWRRATLGSISGHCDPLTATISLPESIYIGACNGEKQALMVVFHEIGHLILGHQALLHFSNESMTQDEDAEWQADMFAIYALQWLGFEESQLSLSFQPN